MVDNQIKELFGSWVQANGTFIAAVGATPSSILTDQQLNNLSLIGNGLQAIGNALIADTIEQFNLEKIGNELQAIGNSTVVSGMVLPVDDITSQELVIKGNGLQALGGCSAIGDGFFAQLDEPGEAINVISNLLLGIGNSLQAIGGIEQLRSGNEEDGEVEQVLGSWIQTVGSVLGALEVTKETYSPDTNESS